MSKSEYLISKYIPELHKLLVKRGYNRGDKLDSKIEEQLETKLDVKTNLIRLLLEIESSGNQSFKAFAIHVNELIKRIRNIYQNKEKKIWESINGKFDNLDGWNFYNPIGELSVLDKQIHNDKIELIEIEASFPNGKTKDFLFINKQNNSKFYIEVVNIHLPLGLSDSDKIKKVLLDKISKKIEEEIKGITDYELLKSLFILPIVWSLDIDFLKKEYKFLLGSV
jgi:hypothetical protein